MAKKRAIIRVFGIVQGVGFRPFIHKLVNKYGFKGWVQNSTSGVTIDIEGEEEDILKFVQDIPDKAPDLAVVESVTLNYHEIQNYDDFKIVKSDEDEDGFVLISPDVSTCHDCYRELTDPHNKRYRYPFINCTNCGPRFTIIKDLPYDRDKTTMGKFKMCRECSNEYYNIEDRRYHAQPNCCSECGPKIEFVDNHGNMICGDKIEQAILKLKEGYIVAIKGLGGFHLACDAKNVVAVREMRKRKHRDEKPFALMCKDVDHMRKYVEVSEAEEKILRSIRRPIVLLKKKIECSLNGEIAPDTNYLGFMLPYTPLHFLLFEEGGPEVLIMTSGNISDNPVVYKNEDACKSFGSIADYFLIHNREINTRCDDTVLKVVEGREYFIRRSRGYAPFPIKLNMKLKPMLACGAEQKASFCISKSSYVFLSQHIGDLKNYETLLHYEDQIDNFKRLFKVEPEAVVCDLHPDYLSTSYAQSVRCDKKVYVQHHHAHMASCMADNNLEGDVIGITYDGTGLGIDNTVWGGEILTGGYHGFERKGTFLPVPMPGGDRAVKNIAYMALSYMIKTYGEEFERYLPFHLRKENIEFINMMIKKSINSPYTSSCGRLFDGISSIVGLCMKSSYEGQGAIRLEKVADCGIKDILDFEIKKINGMYVYDWRSTIQNIINLINKNADIGYISSAFHNTIVEATTEQCILIRYGTGLNRIVLSGGVFQNNIILHRMVKKLKDKGFDVYIHCRVSANDEGISLGQLVIAQNGGGFNVPGGSIKDNIH